MYLLMVGINFHSAPQGVREKMAGEKLNLPEFLAGLNQVDKLAGSIILPTSSGVEIYTSTRDLPEAEKNIRQFLSKRYDLEGSRLNEYVYVYTLNDCIRHLFRVIAALDGVFADAGQALKQARESYRLACDNEAANNVLCTLFEKVADSVEKVLAEAGAGNKDLIEDGMEQEMERFFKWLNSGFVAPTVGALNKKGQEIREKELQKALNRLDGLSDKDKEIVASLAESVVSKLLNDPVNALKTVSETGQGHLYTKILRNLFCIKNPDSAGNLNRE
ncbi:MAG TPA: hypothetical protein VNT57_05370 [Desulfobacteria bacterium]|nr:hypothetical protein [Desulfobacteria bacterium]